MSFGDRSFPPPHIQVQLPLVYESAETPLSSRWPSPRGSAAVSPLGRGPSYNDLAAPEVDEVKEAGSSLDAHKEIAADSDDEKAPKSIDIPWVSDNVFMSY